VLPLKVGDRIIAVRTKELGSERYRRSGSPGKDSQLSCKEMGGSRTRRAKKNKEDSPQDQGERKGGAQPYLDWER